MCVRFKRLKVFLFPMKATFTILSSEGDVLIYMTTLIGWLIGWLSEHVWVSVCVHTFWSSSGVSLVMLRICWASCRFIPVILVAAADCWPARPLASAAAWLAIEREDSVATFTVYTHWWLRVEVWCQCSTRLLWRQFTSVVQLTY